MITEFSEQDLTDMLDQIKPYTQGRNIVLSLNLMRIGLPTFKISKIIDLMLDRLDSKYIAVQSYSEFLSRSDRKFSRYHTPVTPYLSTLSKISFKQHPNKRLLSPTHSFVLFGATSDICNHTFTSAFGDNSIFLFFLTDLNAKIV